MGEHARLFTTIWGSEDEIKEKLFDKTKELQPMELMFLDMPYVCKQNKDGYNFVKALAECPDLELFGRKSVQIIIDT